MVPNSRVNRGIISERPCVREGHSHLLGRTGNDRVNKATRSSWLTEDWSSNPVGCVQLGFRIDLSGVPGSSLEHLHISYAMHPHCMRPLLLIVGRREFP